MTYNIRWRLDNPHPFSKMNTEQVVHLMVEGAGGDLLKLG